MVIVHLLREAVRAGVRIYATGPKFWGARGYKQGYRQSIDHIVWIGGAAAESFKSMSTGDELDAVQTIPQKPTSSIQSKTRSGFKRNSRRCYPARYTRYGRSSNSRSYYSSANSNRR